MRISSTVAAGAACLLCAVAFSTAALAQPAGVQPIVSAYIERYFETHPSVATQAGRHDFDRQLEDLSAARRADWLTFNREALARITAAASAKDLSPDDRLDAEALTAQIQREILALGVLKRPECDPLYWTAILENANVFLLVRDDLPLGDRLARVDARTRLIPRLVEQAKEALGRSDPAAIAPELVRIAASQARASAGFFATGLAAAAEGQGAIEVSLQTDGSAAARALNDLAAFFDQLAGRASGSPRLGAHYAAAFRWGTGIDEPLSAVLARAQVGLRGQAG